MPKFKVGDNVRLSRLMLGDLALGLAVGDVGVISGTAIHSYYCDFASAKNVNVIDAQIEANTPKEDAEGELQRLVRLANEGLNALKELQGKPIKLISQGRPYLMDYNLTPVEIKPPRPTFEPFTVGGMCDAHPLGWLVELKGDTLHVGCKYFRAKELREDLAALKKDNLDHALFHVLAPSRNGVYQDEHFITWADADRILDALEKAGI